MKQASISVLVVWYLLATACSPQNKISGSYTFKTECYGVELDGSQTLKAWGKGRNRFDAIEQARKNAVRDVLFKGINEGKPECEKRPVILEVNAEEKYVDYFNRFFADKGEYLNYVSTRDERIGQRIVRDRMRSRDEVTHGIVVRVLRRELIQKLMTDEILKKQ